MDGPSVKCVIQNPFLFYIWIQWKLVTGEIVVMCTKTSQSFIELEWKTKKKFFLMTHLMDGPSVKGRWIGPKYH